MKNVKVFDNYGETFYFKTRRSTKSDTAETASITRKSGASIRETSAVVVPLKNRRSSAWKDAGFRACTSTSAPSTPAPFSKKTSRAGASWLQFLKDSRRLA